MIRPNFKLSKNFSYYELTRTDHKDLQAANRNVTDKQVEKLTELCKTILEPIRKNFRLPVTVTSGYRSVALNNRLGSINTSQHVLCEAADIVVNGLDDKEGSLHVFNWIFETSDIRFGQVIHEIKRCGNTDVIWIHISLGAPYRVKEYQVLKYRKGLYQPILNRRHPRAI